MSVVLTGVQCDQSPLAELECHRLDRAGPEVDPERFVRAPAERRELVEQSGLRANPVVLDA